MSVKKEDRWVGVQFRREIGPYSLEVEASLFEEDYWHWFVRKGDENVASGRAPDEKTAKLKARLVVDRCLRRDAKGGRR